MIFIVGWILSQEWNIPCATLRNNIVWSIQILLRNGISKLWWENILSINLKNLIDIWFTSLLNSDERLSRCATLKLAVEEYPIKQCSALPANYRLHALLKNVRLCAGDVRTQETEFEDQIFIGHFRGFSWGGHNQPKCPLELDSVLWRPLLQQLWPDMGAAKMTQLASGYGCWKN